LFINFSTDNEGDKINIVCEDDFNFFMEESCARLTLNFAGPSRKRSVTSVEGDSITEFSKKLRKQLASIEISSDSSDMDPESNDENSDSELSVPINTPTQVTTKSPEKAIQTEEFGDVLDKAIIYKVMRSKSTASSQTEPIASTSSEAQTPSAFSYGSLECSSIEIVDNSIQKSIDDTQMCNEKIQIISNEVIKPADTEDQTVPVETLPEIQQNDENGNAMECDNNVEMKDINEPKPTNRILISDSDEDDDAQNNNQQQQQQQDSNDSNNNRSHYASATAYAYTNLNGDRFESTATDSNGRRHRRHHRTRGCRSNSRRFEESNFREQMRSFNRMNAENFERLNENLRMTGEQVGRTFTATAQMFPDLMSNFRSHFFRPLFNAGVHQHFFDPSPHH
jgi:hypothetical protein